MTKEREFSYIAENEGRVDLISSRVLSMGMSGDWKTAIECGSTEVRIGTAIFGGRS